jgi:hypothetical protein
MSVQDKLFPGNGKLIFDQDNNASAVIVDAELDPIECVFYNDECIDLNTENLTYLKLSVENLHTMIRLIEDSENHYLAIE